jgi:hypothetical protein
VWEADVLAYDFNIHTGYTEDLTTKARLDVNAPTD